MNEYEKKQRRKAYALFYVRQHSRTAHRARNAYRAGLWMMLAMMILAGIYAWQNRVSAVAPTLACAYIVLILALLGSYRVLRKCSNHVLGPCRQFDKRYFKSTCKKQ